jgi:glycosyltransferase involved in cell wall biosynthesis
MRIGIDCRYILNVKYGELAGVGHYTYYLIKYLTQLDKENQYFLFFYNKKIRCEEFEKNENVNCVYFPGLEHIGRIPFLYRHIIIPHILKLYKLDIYHNPANVIPFFYFHKSVITIHDLALYKNADWFPGGQIFSKYILTPFSIYKAKKIIAVSENTKKDLVEMFKVKKNKIEVIYEGVEDYGKLEIEENEIDEKFKFNNPYFLYIGTLEPRKNLVRLINAYAQFLNDNKEIDFKLVLAGKRGWKDQPIFDKIKELKLEKKVVYLGYVTLKEKVYLLKNAYTFVFPSLYEGFGLPILEAVNLGLPIITSNIASIPELVIDNALLVDPYDENSIKKALKRVVNDHKLKDELSRKGKGIAQHFTWEEAAKRTLNLYKNMTQ